MATGTTLTISDAAAGTGAAQAFFTARELAALALRLGYAQLPHSERGVRKFADREGWNDLPKHLSRKRSGSDGGGGQEYHIALVPRLESMLAAERMMQAEITASRAVTAKNDASPPVALSEGQRKVAEARGQVLTAIIAYANRFQMKISRALSAFLLAQEGHSAWLKAVEARDSGAFLTLSHKLKLQEGSPMEGLPPTDAQRPMLTADHEFPFGFGLSAKVVRVANNRPKKGAAFQSVSRRTLFSWLQAYESKGVAGLSPQPSKLECAIPSDFWRFMRLYASPAKPKLPRVYTGYLNTTPEGLQPLSIDQITYILRNKLNHIERAKGREGRLALRSRMAFVSRDTSDILPGTIYVGDGHTFDARIADPVSQAPMRPEITCIIDVATRRAVGWAISRKENIIAVTEALRNSCADHCIPAVVYFDNGAGYKNKGFDDDASGLMSRLDITKMHALPYGSQAKGNIERSRQSIWIPFARELPTYLGEDMDKEARMRVDKQIKADRKEFGRSKLLMPWDDFRQECQRRIDAYNAQPHSSLPRFEDPKTGRIRHMSPDEYWQHHVNLGFEPVLIDPFVIDDLFRPYERRTVNRCLINLWTNEYFSLDLNPYHEQEVFVGYDYNQADRVWVREVDPKTHSVGKLICVAAYGGNKVSYMPVTFLETAMDRREKGRLKRNSDRRFEIEAERNGPLLLDHEQLQPVEFVDLQAAQPEPELLPRAPVTPQAPSNIIAAPQPRRRTFASDEELAFWVLEHPGEITANQIAVLTDCLSRPSAREVFRMAGIDTEALRNLLRATVNQSETSGMRIA